MTGCTKCWTPTTCSGCTTALYYLNVNNTCTVCTSLLGCTNCTSKSVCTVCSATQYFKLNTTSCICMAGYYMSWTTCLPCQSICSTCTSSTKCISCVSGYKITSSYTCVTVIIAKDSSPI
jgi:hypothetical protein